MSGKTPTNYAAWAANMYSFLRLRGLDEEFADWSGGWRWPALTEDNVAALVAERDALKAVVLETDCPRPANSEPDGQSVKDCVALGYCGCCYGAALKPCS